MRCRKCGSEKLGVTPNKKNPSATDLYCLECGAWQKFATRDEIRLYQTRKSVITNADRIRSMNDEEMAKMLWKAGRNYRSICADPVVDYNEHYKHLIEWLQQPAEEDKHELVEL